MLGFEKNSGKRNLLDLSDCAEGKPIDARLKIKQGASDSRNQKSCNNPVGQTHFSSTREGKLQSVLDESGNISSQPYHQADNSAHQQIEAEVSGEGEPFGERFKDGCELNVEVDPFHKAQQEHGRQP